MGKTRPLFVYFCSFPMTSIAQIGTINDKSVDGVLGTRTRGSRMVGAWMAAAQFSVFIYL